MTDLDDLQAIKELDSQDFLSHLEAFPEQVALGRELGTAAEPLPSKEDFREIAVLGMGGSGISGDLLRVLLEPQAPSFVASVKGYDVPRWVGPETLVFAVSYSGTTEETLKTLPEVLNRKATAILIGSGGPLAEMGSSGTAVVRVPPGLPPRAALGYLLMPMLTVCERLGLCDLRQAVPETIELLAQRRDEYKMQTPASRNPAKQLAESLRGTVPVVYGSEGIGMAAAYRWKCQFNECSKVLSFWNAFPELDHNELEGWDGVTAPGLPITVIALRHDGDSGRKGARIDLTLSMIEPRVSGVKQVAAQGNSHLARLFDLIYLGDFTSAYLGLAQGADPGRIRAIPALKTQMGQVDRIETQ